MILDLYLGIELNGHDLFQRMGESVGLVSDAIITGRLGSVTSLAQHTTSLLAFLDGLKDSKTFTDLRIVCEDGVVESYKVLLAACSDLLAGCLGQQWRV